MMEREFETLIPKKDSHTRHFGASVACYPDCMRRRKHPGLRKKKGPQDFLGASLVAATLS
jgi:hypothetical protein